jgi:hypothetical protein
MDNPKYATMKAAEQIWPVSTAHTSDLQELAALGLIQGQDLAEWKEDREHRVPVLCPGEIILFVSFVRASLCLLASPFLHHFLQFNSISLNNLNPNSVLYLSVFVLLSEAFIGIPPSLTLFCYFFRLKIQPSSAKPFVLGGVGI